MRCHRRHTTRATNAHPNRRNAPAISSWGRFFRWPILVLGEEGLHLLGTCLLFVGELFWVSFDDLLNVALKPRLANLADLLVGRSERPLCIADLVRLDKVV
nr:MAG TPA: hypothetical protein [Caudoviricetes sp.]